MNASYDKTTLGLGKLGDLMRLQQDPSYREEAKVEPVFDGEKLRVALLGEEPTLDIHPDCIDNWLDATHALATAMIDSEVMGHIVKDDGTVEPRETCDAHIFLSRIIWACGTQIEYHEKNLARNGQLLQVQIDRASTNQEIETNRLASLTRFRAVCEVSLDFWETLRDKLEGVFRDVTGRPYQQVGKQQKLSAEAGKALAASLTDLISRPRQRRAAG